MGRVASSARVIVTSPGSCFCSWSARGCHIMRSERRRQAHLRRVIHSRECSLHYLRLCRFLRPSDGTSGERSRSRPAPNLLLLPVYAAAASRPQRNVVPFTHMRCKMTASLRANATFARFMPRCRATSSAQRLRAEKRTARVSRMCAPLRGPAASPPRSASIECPATRNRTRVANCPFADLADLEAEAAQEPAKAQLYVAHLGLQLLACP